MQQPVFRDVLWALVEAADRGHDDVTSRAYREVLTTHPGLTRERFEEIIDILVTGDHLRRWGGATEASGERAGAVMPTAKARLQFSAAL